MSRRAFLLAAWLCFAFAAHAQYPAKPIRLISPFPPGGTVDFLGRLVSEGLPPLIGQQVVVENRPGAGGNLGTDLVAKAPPDGYTLGLVASGNLVINPFLYRSMPFDPLNDLVPVFNLGDAPQLLVVPAALPAQNLGEFVAYAKARPLHYASAGAGTTTHLAMDHLARVSGVELQHVPYKGVGQALADLLAARVEALSTFSAALAEQYRGRGAVIHERRGERDAAIRDYQTAIRYNPQYAPSRQALGRLGAPLPQAPHSDEERRATALAEEAAAAARRGDYAAAGARLDEANRIAPRLALVYQYRSNVAYLKGDRAAAIAALKQGLRIEPDNALFRENLKRLEAPPSR